MTRVIEFEYINMPECPRCKKREVKRILKNKENQKHHKKFLQAEAELLGDHESDHDFEY